MTLDELRQWLTGAISPMDEARARFLVARAEAGDAGALHAIQNLKTRTVLSIAKFDKTDIITPGVEGLTPVETVRMEFEEGRLVRSETQRLESRDEGGTSPCR